MNDHSRPDAQHQVLFCPFCQESFEGQTRCPDHELALVPWHALPSSAPQIEDNTWLAPYSLHAGRGWVLLGALLTLLAFVAPMLTLSGESELHANMLRFASLRAGKLWMVPLSAMAQVMILLRRRTPRALRAVRLAMACVVLMPAIALSVTLYGVHQASIAVGLRAGEPTRLTIEWGSYLVFVACAFGLFGAARLGVVPDSSPSADIADGH